MNQKLKNIHQTLQTPHTKDGRVYFHPILMMHAAAVYEKTYTEFMTDYHVLVESNLKLLDLYDHDAVSVISDPYREMAAFGATIHFEGDASPRTEPLIRTEEDVYQLTIPDVYQNERTLDRIKAVAYFREKLGTPFPIIGWVEGPLAEAADLMGMTEVMMDMIIEPEKVEMVLQKTLQMAKNFALAQIKAGANIIGVGDAVCSQIAREMYDAFSLPLHKELFEFIHQQGALVKLHICGNITHLLPSLSETNVDLLDVDWMVDLTDVYRIMGDGVMICGNLDPVSVLLNGDKELIRETYNCIRNKAPSENWIVMAGCEIPRDTPIKNMKYLREISIVKHT